MRAASFALAILLIGTVCPTGSPLSGLRLLLHRKGDADSTNYCHAVSPGASISLGSFSTTCYDTTNPGTALAATDVPNIDRIGVQVPSTSTAITVSKLCLTGITFAK